ncbi:magnesium transporter [Rhodovulum strictum]|uniref:CBS domain-containing protein n=1 Tax=Rhodovulum strictum TaxID=58314 RepID=A0A844BGY7_9RHOB|nr:magnesium transporter [Rhodovulum strictum]MRH21849.1 CBS domain-containing protein [Rhodovulum strictum]
MPDIRRHITRDVPVARVSDSPDAVIAALRGTRHHGVGTVFVVDGGEMLLGQVRLADIFAAAGTEGTLAQFVQAAPVTVHPDTDQEDAASLAIREDLISLPVVDDNGRFLGALPPHALMQVLREEHVEDLHRLAGIWRSAEDARRALTQPPTLRLRHRLPWLLIGLAGSLLATRVVAGFEATLSQHVTLAFFIPLIVYLADAVGTQTEAIAVRGLSLSPGGLGRLLLGEIGTGALIGLCLALLAAGFERVVFGQPGLATVLGVSILAACTIATTIGLLLPWAFSRVGWDPALASGPIATVLQDVLSLLIYFFIAAAVLG